MTAPTDPHTCHLIDRLSALQKDAWEAVQKTRMAIESTDRMLRQTRTILGLPATTAEELERESD